MFVCVCACGSVFVILSVGANVYAVCVGVSVLVAVDVSQGGRALGYSRGWVCEGNAASGRTQLRPVSSLSAVPGAVPSSGLRGPDAPTPPARFGPRAVPAGP